MGAIIKAKPASAKGHFLRKICISTTMGPGVRIERTAFDVAAA